MLFRPKIHFLVVVSLVLLLEITFGQHLKMAVYLTRHGARAPSQDHYDDKIDYWGQRKVSPMGLTEIGMRQHFTLGKAFRKRYIDDFKLLNPSYDVNEIRVYASSQERAISSAISHLMGLFPLGTGPNIYTQNQTHLLNPPWLNEHDKNKIDEGLGAAALPGNYQPIPVYSASVDNDTLFHSHSVSICPNQQKYIDFQLSTELYKNMEIEMYDSLQQILKQLNKSEKKNTLKSIKNILSNYYCDLYDGLKLDLGLGLEFLKNATFMHTFYTTYVLSGHDNQKKLGATVFLNNLLDLFDKATKNEKQPKLAYFSGHDYNIVYVLNALNLTSWQCVLDYYRNGKELDEYCVGLPKFASSLNFELYEEKQKYFVKVLYNGKEMKVCHSVSGTVCLYQEFVSLIKSTTVDSNDYENLCGRPLAMIQIANEQTRFDITYSFSYVLLGIALVGLIFNGWFWWKYRSGLKLLQQENETEMEIV